MCTVEMSHFVEGEQGARGMVSDPSPPRRIVRMELELLEGGEGGAEQEGELNIIKHGAWLPVL